MLCSLCLLASMLCAPSRQKNHLTGFRASRSARTSGAPEPRSASGRPRSRSSCTKSRSRPRRARCSTGESRASNLRSQKSGRVTARAQSREAKEAGIRELTGAKE